MKEYIKKFSNHNEYTAFTQTEDFIKPNVSLCVNENEVHYNPFIETRVICTYNVTTTEEPTLLLLGEDVDCYRPDVDIYEIFSGMEVDGVEQELDQYYQFNTTGEHVIKYTLNDNVTNFEAAFFNVDNLNSIIIPNNVTIIDELAFQDCNNLKSVNIGNSVTSIERLAFDKCGNLESIIIGNSVTNIESDFISSLYKSKLNSIIVNSKNNKYDSRNNCNALIETESNTLILGSKSTVIPNTVTSIEEYAFDGCSDLSSITIPNSVTSIGNCAFEDCSSLTSIIIPNSVTSIGYYAFYNCSGLTSVNIGNSVTSIGEFAFAGCSGLTEVTIPSSVTSIGDYAFRNCSSLSSVTINNSIPPTLNNAYVFQYNANGRKIYVPAESVNIYKAATNWSTYADDIEPIS